MQSVGIWRLVLDTIQPLSASLPNLAVLRAELRRLSGWLKARGVTGGMAGERRDALGALTGQSPKKLVSDFNMVIDQRVGAAGCVGGRAGALSGGR